MDDSSEMDSRLRGNDTALRSTHINASALFLPVVYTLAQILSIMLLGFFLARTGKWPKEFFQTLSRLIIRVVLPLYFFTKLSQTNPGDILSSLLFPVAALAVIAGSVGLASLVFRRFPQGQNVKRVGIALASFGNFGMIPLTLIELLPLTIPVIQERFGTTLPSLYVGGYLLVSSPTMWSFGNYLVTGQGRRPELKNLITPPLLGILAGLCVAVFRLQPLFFHERLPVYYVMKSFERLGAIGFPVILLCLGSMIGRIQFRRESQTGLWELAGRVMVVRFVILPCAFLLLFWTILRHLPLSPAQIWVLFLEMHTPPATNLSLMASQVGVNEDLVSFTALVTYSAYLLLLPLYLIIFLSLPGIL